MLIPWFWKTPPKRNRRRLVESLPVRRFVVYPKVVAQYVEPPQPKETKRGFQLLLEDWGVENPTEDLDEDNPSGAMVLSRDPSEAITYIAWEEAEASKRKSPLFDMEYFCQLLILGKLEEAEMYLYGFTKVDENNYSSKLFHEIRKLKLLEAQNKQDYANAIEILQKELKVFFTSDNQGSEGLTHLPIPDDIREDEGVSSFGNTKSTRNILCAAAKKQIEANPVFENKLPSPVIEKAKLQTLASRSLGIEQVPCGSAGDATKSESKRGRVEVEKRSPFGVHGINITNPGQPNVVRESKKERGKGEEQSSSDSKDVINNSQGQSAQDMS